MDVSKLKGCWRREHWGTEPWRSELHQLTPAGSRKVFSFMFRSVPLSSSLVDSFLCCSPASAPSFWARRSAGHTGKERDVFHGGASRRSLARPVNDEM